MFTRKPLTLPPQLQWQYQDEPALAEWSLKARPYNTDIANGLFVIFVIISAAAAYWHRMLNGFPFIVDILLFCVFISLALSMTHQKTKLAYRLTASGLEFCEWKAFPEWLPTLLKWLAVITGVVMLMLVMVHPAALIGAIAGPGLIGLMYLRMGTSSQFRKMHEQFHQGFHPWNDFTKMIAFRRRSIIGLDFTYFNPQADEGKGRMIDTDRLIYCRKSRYNELIRIIRARLPDSTPYEEAYIQIYA
ncbi:hypothetical protein LCGC14_0259560 [marine sediment metagenome]|uniref:Uncharacterized protein n=1 Tax=marine sediment metagenome TaxID=412755 RepID=A0A0F9U6R4_9ZZZZ|nr:hypothetical protein [Halopseudomonas sabulinigri]